MEIDSKPQALDNVDRADHAAGDRARGAEEGARPRHRASGWTRSRTKSPTCARNCNALTARWQKEKEVDQAIRETKAQIDEAKVQLEQAERRADLEAAARLRYGTLPELDKQLTRARSAR